MTRLRSGVLGGLELATAGAGPGAAGARLRSVAALAARLGADVRALDGGSGEARIPAAGVGALVLDAGPAFGQGGQDGVLRVLDTAWASVLKVVEPLIAAGGGKLILVAPSAEAGELAGAARAGLENLARSLSVEWARHRITACAVCPGADTADDTVAELVAYLLSPAGDYLSGCRLELGAVGAGPRG